MKYINFCYNSKTGDRRYMHKFKINLDHDFSMHLCDTKDEALLAIYFKCLEIPIIVPKFALGQALYEKIRYELYAHIDTLLDINIWRIDDQVDIYLKFGAFAQHAKDDPHPNNHIIINAKTSDIECRYDPVKNEADADAGGE